MRLALFILCTLGGLISWCARRSHRYDGSTLAWKQSQGGYELNSYGGDKGKTKTRLGRYEVREGTNSVEPDSTGSIDDAVADPNTAELALMAAFALDDFEVRVHQPAALTPCAGNEALTLPRFGRSRRSPRATRTAEGPVTLNR